MSNTSATGGPLQFAPTPAPIEDVPLDEFFQNLFVGILGGLIPGNLFLPSWQPEPPNLPAYGTDWAALGITNIEADTFAYFGHVPANGSTPGYDQMQRHEIISIMVSFYGPDSHSIASTLRDGLQIRQNLDPLRAANMGLINTGPLVTAPELIKGRWLRRVDLSVKIRRQVIRNVPILDLTSGQVTIETDVGLTEQVNVTD